MIQGFENAHQPGMRYVQRSKGKQQVYRRELRITFEEQKEIGGELGMVVGKAARVE